MAEQLAAQFEPGYWSQDPETGLPNSTGTQAGQLPNNPAKPFDPVKTIGHQGGMGGRQLGGFGRFAEPRNMETRFGSLFVRQFNNIARRVISKPAQHVQNTPKQIVSMTLSESVYAGDHTVSLVNVQFIRDGNDPNYQYTNIWIQGYQSSSATRLVANAVDSPHSFTLESTGETITVICQAVGQNGVAASLANAPRMKVILNGQTTQPSAPTIAAVTSAMTQGANTVGYQFQYNIVPPSTGQLIDGYWIYRTTSSTTPVPPASRLAYQRQPASDQSVQTFQDGSGASTNYYFVSAVNTAGLESSLASAGSAGAGGGSTTTTYRPTTNTAISGGGFANPANVYDGNSNSYASAAVSASATFIESSWQGYPSATGTNSTTLKVLSGISTTGPTCKLEYSKDNGSTWTTIYSVNANRANTTDVISIPVATNISQVKVRASGTYITGGSASFKVYEAWIETT